MKHLISRLASFVMGLTIAATAFAYQVSGQINVEATFIPMCEVTGTSLDFGEINPSIMSGNIDKPATFSVTCTHNTPYSVSLNLGTNSVGEQRQLKNGFYYLNYALYQETCNGSLWGNGSAGGDKLTDKVGTGSAQEYTVCGRITGVSGQPPGDYHMAAPGLYNDVVNITVEF